MCHKASFSDSELSTICIFHQDGKTPTKISQLTGRSHDAIRRCIKRTNAGLRLATNRRNTKVTERDRRLITNKAAIRACSAFKLKSELSISVSTRQIHRILRVTSHVVRKNILRKPRLMPRQAAVRLAWAEERPNWGPDRWNEIVFSDEKKWNLDVPDGFSYYLHDLRKEKVILSQSQSGDGGVLNWAPFSAKGFSEICFCSGKQ